MSDDAALIAVAPGIILAAVAVVYGGMAAAIGYLWKGHQDLNLFIRNDLMRISGGSLHREKVHHWMLSRMNPELMAEAEAEVGRIDQDDHNQTATLPAAKPVGHGSRRNKAVTKSGEHRLGATILGILCVGGSVVAAMATLLLLASCAGVM